MRSPSTDARITPISTDPLSHSGGRTLEQAYTTLVLNLLDALAGDRLPDIELVRGRPEAAVAAAM
jgi:hypothetical protein